MDGSKKKVQKELQGGILMGKELDLFDYGKFGYLYDDGYSHLLVKQLAFENDRGSDLVKEYNIARLLETNLPSFVAGPFMLMRGVAPSNCDYEEKLSFIQQKIHGKTFNDILMEDFSTLELWSMFLQYNEFWLRVGGALEMRDVHCGNVMVDVRMSGNPRVKFIDFGLWHDTKQHYATFTSAESYSFMLQNLSYAKHPMQKLLILMGFKSKDYDILYGPLLPHSDQTDILYELPARITTLFKSRFFSTGDSDIISQSFRILQKLCSIRYVQRRENKPIDMISELVLSIH